jgi:hypothetical protein
MAFECWGGCVVRRIPSCLELSPRAFPEGCSAEIKGALRAVARACGVRGGSTMGMAWGASWAPACGGASLYLVGLAAGCCCCRGGGVFCFWRRVCFGVCRVAGLWGRRCVLW